MMSTEFSGARTQPQISPTAGTTLVEVTSEQVFRGSPNLDNDDHLLDSDEDKLMMTEYDEDNVIVIDLSEERNASAKNQLLIEDQPVPRQMFGSESMEEEDSEYAVDNNGGVHSEPEESSPPPPDYNQEGPNNGIELASIPSHDYMSQGEPDTASNPRENCSLAPNEGQENHESQESPDPSFHPEDIDEEAELPIPPLQKTISRDNEVHWPPVEAVEAATTPIRKGVLKNSGKLPPVVPGYKSPRKEVRQSPHRRIKKLHRSKTVENADLNGHEHVVTPNNIWKDLEATTTTEEDYDEVRGAENNSGSNRQHRVHRSSKRQPRLNTDTVSNTSEELGSSMRPLTRRSASCRRALEAIRPLTSTSYNIMSMSMIGNSLGYGEVDAFERRRKARSNDFLDRIDPVSVVSTRSATLNSKRKVTPKMSRIEQRLYLGSLEAATDVILLESNAITHIVTVDSVPLPRKITSLMPRIAMLHLQVTDMPEEDLLSHFEESNAFIADCLAKEGAVLIHCYRGRSRSATVMVAFLMQKHGYSAERALAKVRNRREIIQPHDSFLAQLKLFENMDFTIDPGNLQFKMFRLHMAAERMRKAKILFRDILDSVIDPDPAGGLPGSAASQIAAASKGRYPMVYKCKKCRRTLATAFNLMPHLPNETPFWTASKWSLSAEDILEAAAEKGLQLCSASLFINPVRWMEPEIRQNLSGRLYCPNCQTRVGQYSWVMGQECCPGKCMAKVIPAFSLDVTEIIFRTKNRFLQSNQREPVVV